MRYRTFVLCPLAFVFAASAAHAQATPPSAGAVPSAESIATMAGRLERLLADTNLRAVDVFLDAYRSARRPDDVVARQRALLSELVREAAPLTVREYALTPTGRILELWSDRRARGVTVAFSVDREAPAQLWNLQALRTVIPEAVPRLAEVPRGDLDALATAIRDEVRRLGSVGALSGQVLVADHDRILVHEAVGVRDTLGTPLTRTSLLAQASAPKMLVAIAVAQLVERGALRWDDSLTRLLPRLDWHPSAGGVTVRQLLTHRAGYGSLWDVPGFDRARDYERMTEIAALIAPRAVRPTEAFSYSNEGFELLASVVEAVSGQPYHEYLAANVLAPAGVTRAFAPATAAALADRAAGLPGSASDPLSLRPRTRQGALDPWRGTGAGGGYASAEEWFRLLRALHDGRLVSAAIRDTLFTPYEAVVGGPSVLQYGFGFFVESVAGTRFVGHGGGGPFAGVCNEIRTAIDGSWTVIVLTNGDPPMCQALTDRLVRARPPDA